MKTVKIARYGVKVMYRDGDSLGLATTSDIHRAWTEWDIAKVEQCKPAPAELLAMFDRHWAEGGKRTTALAE